MLDSVLNVIFLDSLTFEVLNVISVNSLTFEVCIAGYRAKVVT